MRPSPRSAERPIDLLAMVARLTGAPVRAEDGDRAELRFWLLVPRLGRSYEPADHGLVSYGDPQTDCLGRWIGRPVSGFAGQGHGAGTGALLLLSPGMAGAGHVPAVVRVTSVVVARHTAASNATMTMQRAPGGVQGPSVCSATEDDRTASGRSRLVAVLLMPAPWTGAWEELIADGRPPAEPYHANPPSVCRSSNGIPSPGLFSAGRMDHASG